MSEIENAVKLKPSQLKPWLKYFPEESIGKPFTEVSLYQYLKDVSKDYYDCPAIDYYGTKFTFGGLVKSVDAAAAAYVKMGVKKGDIVSYLTITIPEVEMSLYALNKIGAVSNFIDPRMDVQRIADAVNSTNSRFLLPLDITWPKVEKVMEISSVEKVVILQPSNFLPFPLKTLKNLKDKSSTPKIPYDENVMTWNKFIENGRGTQAEQYYFEKGEMAIITYTSGTTGTPKGVMITNEGMNAVVDSFHNCSTEWKLGCRFLDIMPVFASYGVVCGIHMPMALHLENVIIPKLDPDKMGYLMKKYKPVSLMGVPAYYEKLMNSKEMVDFDLSFLSTCGCGGDRINSELQRQINSFLKSHHAKFPLSQGYGMSELSSAATCCFRFFTKEDSAGFPMLCSTVGIFDPETGEELDFDQQGEVCVTGPAIMKGYYGMPEETAHVLRVHEDGKTWVHTGDVGFMDEDGFLFIRGRIKQLIIRFDGHKLAPVLIEKVINEHNEVAICAVIGVKDPDHMQGHCPIGIIELKDKNATDEDKARIRREVLKLCDEVCEERGRPADVTFIDEMPHTSMGKHDYLALERMFKDFVINKEH